MKKHYLIACSLVLSTLLGCASEQPVQQASYSEDSSSANTRNEGDSAQARQLNNSGLQGSTIANSRQQGGRGIRNTSMENSIYYDFDKYSVKEEYRPVVQSHAGYLSSRPQTKVRVEGNCDERGSREYNLALGQRRADSVKSMLTILGVSDNQIETISYGEEKPRELGGNESAWSENRRSDLVYIGAQ